MKKVAVILAGCGLYDGSEIHESVLTLLALDRAQAKIVCTAPDMPQLHVINHLTGQPMGETRNVLVEAARIARGEIVPLSQLQLSEIDALIVPGGFGAAKNLCNFAVAGESYSVNPEVAKLLREAHCAGKPIGFICIAPAICAKVFGTENVQFTIGSDAETAAALQKSGGRHVDCTVQDIVVDQRLKIVTTPAYMLGECLAEIEAGINKLVQKVLEMA